MSGASQTRPNRAVRARRRSWPVAAWVLGALVVLGAGSGVVVTGSPASAHDALLSSDPADGAVVPVPPDVVTLAFSGEQMDVGAAVAVLAGDGTDWADGAPEVAGTTVTQTLRAGMPAGSYTVQWRSVSSDGHPIDGSLVFTAETDDPTADAAAGGVPGEQAPAEGAPGTGDSAGADDTAGDGDATGEEPSLGGEGADDGSPTATDDSATEAGPDTAFGLGLAALAAVAVVLAMVVGLRRRGGTGGPGGTDG